MLKCWLCYLFERQDRQSPHLLIYSQMLKMSRDDLEQSQVSHCGSNYWSHQHTLSGSALAGSMRQKRQASHPKNSYRLCAS